MVIAGYLVAMGRASTTCAYARLCYLVSLSLALKYRACLTFCSDTALMNNMDWLTWLQVKANQLTAGLTPAPRSTSLLKLSGQTEQSGKGWEVLLVHAHPCGTNSFSGGLAAAVRKGLIASGHTVTTLSLYKEEDGEPIVSALSRQERIDYFLGNRTYPK
eukprot:g78350.t1